MHTYVGRLIADRIEKRLRNAPCTAILGPRQCGKSTLAKNILKKFARSLYLDIELPSDINKLRDAENFFDMNQDRLICIDEIQRYPDIFKIMRSFIDSNKKNAQFLILGSASRDLIKQGSETLAGRISFFELTPFLLPELTKLNNIKIVRNLWLKGGYPRSYLNNDLEESYAWRIDFIRTFMERDIFQYKERLSVNIVNRLLSMSAHISGNILNLNKLGGSLGINYHTVDSYLTIFEQMFIIRIVPPYEKNIKKRIIKSPKLYIRDTGILHALLNIKSENDLLGSPNYGESWEAFVIENIISNFPDFKYSFYRNSNGNEIDLLIETSNKLIAVECKASASPQVSKGLLIAMEDLKIDKTFIVSPVKNLYPVKDNIFVCGLFEVIGELKQYR